MSIMLQDPVGYLSQSKDMATDFYVLAFALFLYKGEMYGRIVGGIWDLGSSPDLCTMTSQPVAI